MRTPSRSRMLVQRRLRRSHGASSAGLSLAEILMGTVALGLALAMAAVMNGIATSGIGRSSTLNERNALVDTDIAAIRALAEAYTWCSGSGAFAADASSATCLSSDPADESYYSPAVSQAEASTLRGADKDVDAGNNAMDQFQAACADGTLNNTLRTRINDLTPPPGMDREVNRILDGSVDTHRLEILYRPTSSADPNPMHRTVVVAPTVAAWCPG